MAVDRVPASLARRAVEAAAWIEFGCPDHALTKLEPLLATPGGRPVGLKLSVTALVELKRYAEAIRALDELRSFDDDISWIEVTEAWCRKRTEDLAGAIRCMERLIAHDRRSPIGHFNLGCYLAIHGDHDRALDEVSLACGLDPSFRELLADESDLDPIRDDPRFAGLLPPE